MAKNLDISNSGAGDLTNFFRSRVESDYSWLDVNEEEYRKSQALPKQNIDIIPDVQKFLSEEDGIPHALPVKEHLMVNSRPTDIFVDHSSKIKRKAARLMMAGKSDSEVYESLSLEFGSREVDSNKQIVASVLSERGLMGNIYFNASDFPNCHNDPKEQKFVKLACKKSLNVIQKKECSGCVHNTNGHCSSFGSKKLVSSVQYDEKLLEKYKGVLSSEGRSFPAPKNQDWKESFRIAFNSNPENKVPFQKAQIVKDNNFVSVSDNQVKEFFNREVVSTSLDLEYLKYAKRMMIGKDDRSHLAASENRNLSFLSTQYGVLGHTILDMDALGGCKETLKFIISMNKGISLSSDIIKIKPDYIIRRSSCNHCECSEIKTCDILSKISKVVDDYPSLTKSDIRKASSRAYDSGRISEKTYNELLRHDFNGIDIRNAVSKINTTVEEIKEQRVYSGPKHTHYSGSVSEVVINSAVVNKYASHLMNMGSKGNDLREKISSKFGDIEFKSDNEGLQGSYYIDPTVYDDYGSGCNAGSKLLKKKVAKNVLSGSKCTGCSYQTHPGWCSKYSKCMISFVPQEIRTAYTKRSLPVLQNPPIDNTVEKYEIKTTELIVEKAPTRSTVNIKFK